MDGTCPSDMFKEESELVPSQTKQHLHHTLVQEKQVSYDTGNMVEPLSVPSAPLSSKSDDCCPGFHRVSVSFVAAWGRDNLPTTPEIVVKLPEQGVHVFTDIKPVDATRLIIARVFLCQHKLASSNAIGMKLDGLGQSSPHHEKREFVQDGRNFHAVVYPNTEEKDCCECLYDSRCYGDDLFFQKFPNYTPENMESSLIHYGETVLVPIDHPYITILEDQYVKKITIEDLGEFIKMGKSDKESLKQLLTKSITDSVVQFDPSSFKICLNRAFLSGSYEGVNATTVWTDTTEGQPDDENRFYFNLKFEVKWI